MKQGCNLINEIMKNAIIYVKNGGCGQLLYLVKKSCLDLFFDAFSLLVGKEYNAGFLKELPFP